MNSLMAGAVPSIWEINAWWGRAEWEGARPSGCCPRDEQGWVGAEHCLVKRSSLEKCLIFTANCRGLEGFAKRSDLCLKDMWEACGRSDYDLSTSRFHACTAPSSMGGLPSLPPQFPSGKGLSPQILSIQPELLLSQRGRRGEGEQS